MKQATLNFKTILTVVLSSFLMLMCSNDERAINETEEDVTSSAIIQGSQSSSPGSSSGTSSTDAQGREIVEFDISVTENQGLNLTSCDSIPFIIKLTCAFGFPDYGLSGDDTNIDAFIAGEVGVTSKVKLYSGDTCSAEVLKDSIGICAGSVEDAGSTLSASGKVGDDLKLDIFKFSVTDQGDARDISSSVNSAILLNVTKDVTVSDVSGTLAPDHVLASSFSNIKGDDKCGNTEDANDVGLDDGCVALEIRLRSASGATVTNTPTLTGGSCQTIKNCAGTRACQYSVKDGKHIPNIELAPGDIYCYLHDQDHGKRFTDPHPLSITLENGSSSATFNFDFEDKSLPGAN